MEQYIALLRGINVGGNVLFSAVDDNMAALQQRCQQAITDKFGLDISVAVISAAEYSDVFSNAPEWWDNDIESKHNAVFVIAPANASDLIQKIGLHSEYEKVFGHGAVIFWSAPLKTFSRTKWSKMNTTSAYSNITIRNANTAKKLLMLLEHS